VYLAQTARLRAVQVAAANQALHDEIHQHQRTESSLADRIEQMEAVRAVTAEIARELELTTLLHLITQRAVNLVEAARSGAVYLWDEPHAVLIPQAWYGRGEWMQDVRIGLGEGVVGAVAQRQTGCIIDDYHASPYEEYLVAEHPGATAIVAEPLLYRDRLVGVIVLDNWSTTQPFTEEDRELLTLFAGQAAVAIQNARLFADLQERTAHLGQLNVELHNQISERQQAEEQLQRQQEALFQSEKLAAMGSLLASVAHELNNPLSVVTMQAELLGDELTDKGMAERVRLITQSAERCVRIVQNFLALARQNPPQRTQVSLNAVVEEAMELLSYPLQVDDVDIIWQPADDLPPLWADPHQLHQVIVNLVTNAHQALRDTSTPRQLRLTTRSSAARTDVSLEVGDSGAGIPSSLQERIFEPFFTTKPPGVGTGLGLPFCKGIVEGHGGSISIQSQPGHGTVFRVELPVDALPAPATEVPAVETSPTTGGKAILVIDDEPGITSALAYLLRRDGHTVETAAHGRQALAQLQKGEYDLILCDLRMPELDGPGFYRELGQQYPQLLRRVIFLTGDTLSPEARGFLEQVGVPRLNKPFRAAEVRRIVQQALHGL
jgi:two-component system NtrC family sensor kinase